MKGHQRSLEATRGYQSSSSSRRTPPEHARHQRPSEAIRGSSPVEQLEQAHAARVHASIAIEDAPTRLPCDNSALWRQVAWHVEQPEAEDEEEEEEGYEPDQTRDDGVGVRLVACGAGGNLPAIQWAT